MKKYCSLMVILLFSLFLASCSKKNDNPAAPADNGIPTTEKPVEASIPNILFKGPETASKDSYVQLTDNMIDVFNALPKYITAQFGSLKPVKGENDWKWTVSPQSGFTMTMTATKNSDGGFSWTLIQNGTIDTLRYNNWKALDGSTSADGKNGNWKAYEDNSDLLSAEFSWTTDAGGVLSGTYKIYNGTSIDGKTTVVNRPDKSGEVKSYRKNEVIYFEASWNSRGSGLWKSYTNGFPSSEGSWR